MDDLFPNPFRDFQFQLFDAGKLVEAMTFKMPDITPAPRLNSVVEEMFNSNQKMIDNIIKNAFTASLPSMSVYLPEATVEIQEIEPTVLDTGSAVKQPRATKQKLSLGFYLLSGNSFEYNRKKLKSFSLDTQHGNLLHSFLTADSNFLYESDLLERFEKDEPREITFIIRNLKTAFKKNNLEIIIEKRKNPKGWVVIDIKELQ